MWFVNFLDLFSGIGGFRFGMEMAGHSCVGYVEKDVFARNSYEAIHQTEGEWTAHDIRTVTDDDLGFLRGRNIDVLCGGFPCQSFSVAGRRAGFEDTRGTLFFEIARFAQKIQPRYLFLENVKGVLSHDQGNTYGTMLYTLDGLGYDCEWQVLNSSQFGVPQNRQRLFLIGHLRRFGRRKIFPISRTDQATDIPIQILAHRDGFRRNTQVFSPEGITETLDTGQGGGRGHYTVIPVLTPERTEKKQNGRRFKEDGEPMFTLTAKDNHGIAIREANKKGYDVAYKGDSINLAVPTSSTRRGRIGKNMANTLDTGCYQGVLTEEYRIRKLTPRECWRLQGFPDWAFDKAREINSDCQLYKQAGNAVTVNVISEIAKRL